MLSARFIASLRLYSSAGKQQIVAPPIWLNGLPRALRILMLTDQRTINSN
jgi:hypothetical protein